MKALLITLFLAAVIVTAIPVSAGATTIDTQQTASHWHRWHHRHHRYSKYLGQIAAPGGLKCCGSIPPGVLNLL